MFFLNFAFFITFLFSSSVFAYECSEVVEKLNILLAKVVDLEQKIDSVLKNSQIAENHGDSLKIQKDLNDLKKDQNENAYSHKNNLVNGSKNGPSEEQNLDVDSLKAGLFADKTSEKDLYDQAYMLMKNGKHREAESNFHSFLLMFPSSKFAPEANYWIAELNYHDGNFRNAAVYFVKAYTADTNGIRAPMSLLKLAGCLVELKNSVHACSVLGKMFRNFPGLIYSLKSQACELSAKIKCDHYEDFCS